HQAALSVLHTYHAMTAAGATRERWDTGGLTFMQPSVGTGNAEGEDMWDDRAILKAFDDALNSHSRKPVDGVEARKWNKHAAQGVAAQPHTAEGRQQQQQQPSTPSSTSRAAAAASGGGGTSPAGAGYQRPRSVPSGHRDQGFQEADRRFASLLAKGNAEASSGGGTAGVRAGIPGPWEPVAGPTEGQQYGRAAGHQDDPGQRTEYARPGAYDPNARQEEYGGGAHNYSYPARAAPHHPQPPPHPPGGAAGGFEEGGREFPLPPPPPPPHPGVGPHAAVFQVTSPPAVLALHLSTLENTF
ncbi:unnamed protein product, partial [Ectocarpus sp. 8 AP-2014]